MDNEMKAEVQAFKDTMARCGLSWSRDDIAQPAQYNELPPDQKEYLMLHAADRWTSYHEILCAHGEKEFADQYFPIDRGPACSRLWTILREINYTHECDLER